MSTAEQQPSGHSESEGKLVYVVDDESMIGDVVQLVLRMDGYKPKYFQDPEAALRSFTDEEPKPALLLTDFLMSPINGLELIERCKRLRPQLRTILYSGNAGEDILRHYRTAPDGFLRKPFLPKALLALVRVVLNAAPTAALACLAAF